MRIKKLEKRKLLSIPFIIFCGLLSACANENPQTNKTSNRSDQPTPDNNSRGVLIKYKPALSNADQQTLLKANGLTLLTDYSLVPGLIYAEVADNVDLTDTIKRPGENENIVYAEPTYAIA
jgi:hypothetical protein